MKRLHASIAHDIPKHWRVCGENLFAQHAIHYHDLPSYFMAFSIWNEDNRCLSWSASLEWFELLSLPTPSVLYHGIWDEQAARDLAIDTTQSEGYVVRLQDSFHYNDFAHSIAKWVRSAHVSTDKHWMHAAIKPNGLRETQHSSLDDDKEESS